MHTLFLLQACFISQSLLGANFVHNHTDAYKKLSKSVYIWSSLSYILERFCEMLLGL